MTEKLIDLLEVRGKAGYAAIYLQSLEDQRTLREIRQAADVLKRKMFFWTINKGIIEDSRRTTAPLQGTGMPTTALEKIKDLPQDSILVLRQFHHFLPDLNVQALLLDVIPEMKLTRKMIIILSPVVVLPPEVEKEITLLEAPLPDEESLTAVLDGIFEASGIAADKRPDADRKKLLIDAAKGLTTQEAENAFTLSIIEPRKQGKRKLEDLWDPAIVIREKCFALRKSQLLEYIRDVPAGLEVIGGMEELKDWVRPLQRAFTKEALDFGLAYPKGVLLVGPPGTGKSLFSKVAAAALGKPLLKLDMGKLYQSLVGSSEANIRMAIRLAEAMSPCVLWLDEIEKGAAGASGGHGDSGVSARVLGTLLTWMQEKTSPVFVVATANDVTMLPPELLRKGRFDEMFSIDLPTKKERREILMIHIKRRNREALYQHVGGTPAKIDLDHFAGETSKDFTGAEIDGAIEQAMRVAYHNNRDLNSVDLQEAFDSTQPIAKTMLERLQLLRNWCAARTRPANRKEVSVQAQMGVAGRRIDA
jgi:AAA+ superfamily predicted ATPase